jgi:DNA processing protein
MGEEKACWLALSCVGGIGAVRFRTLLDAFGSIEAAWHATPEELRGCGIGPAAASELYADGKIEARDRWAVAVVGTRKPTTCGISDAQGLRCVAAGNGVGVSLGLGWGVGTLAHPAALEAGGRTVAVRGSGLD